MLPGNFGDSSAWAQASYLARNLCGTSIVFLPQGSKGGAHSVMCKPLFGDSDDQSEVKDSWISLKFKGRERN